MFFRKKNKENYDEKFKTLYKRTNQTMQDARNEFDPSIKKSLLLLVLDDYKDMLDCINNGANYDKDFVLSLQRNVEKELEGIIDEN